MKGTFEFIKALWAIFNGPGNDPIVIGLITAVVAVLASHVTAYLLYRARIKDKDKQIEDLTKEKNKLLEHLLSEKSIIKKERGKGKS